MKGMKLALIGLVVGFITTNISWSLPAVSDILKKMDSLQELKSDMTSRVNITQRKANQGDKVIESIFYRRDADDTILIIMIAPDADKGNGYLRVGDNFWMYRVNTRTFQHINRDESISGSDVKSGDFEKRKLTELYKGALDANGKEKISEDMLGKIPVYKLEVIAKVNDVTYPKEVYWVRQDNFLPLKVQAYSLSGTLMQSAYYLQYTTVDGKFIPVKQMFVDEFEKGNRSVMEISSISFQKLDPSIFTKAYLENLSK
jgi:hypothetical protein